MNETTEILFDSIVEDTAYAELGQSICTTETAMGNEVEGPVCSNVQPSGPRRTKKAVETKPERNARKKSFFGRLEEARNGACRGLSV